MRRMCQDFFVLEKNLDRGATATKLVPGVVRSFEMLRSRTPWMAYGHKIREKCLLQKNTIFSTKYRKAVNIYKHVKKLFVVI
jgi:hypothetical protein